MGQVLPWIGKGGSKQLISDLEASWRKMPPSEPKDAT